MKHEKRGTASTVDDVVRSNTGEDFRWFSERPQEDIPGMDNLVSLMAYAQYHQVTIHVVADFDVDGEMSAAIMDMGLTYMGIPHTIRIPKRLSEGYGLSEIHVDEVNDGILLTVDNGIAAIEPFKKAKAKGLITAIMDHHQPVRDDDGNLILPPADILVDPHVYSGAFKDYCAAGLSYKLWERIIPKDNPLLKKMGCLAAVATVADVMPLVNANWWIVKDGIQWMEERQRTSGLGALLYLCGLNHITAKDIGFKIAPMLNAPGRMEDDGARKAYECVVFDGPFNEAKAKAVELFAINEERKKVKKDEYMRVTQAMMSERAQNDVPIVVAVPDLHPGIVGILAGNLAEEFNAPAIVMTSTESMPYWKGSGRSPEGCGVNLYNLLKSASSTIRQFGGHEGAAGISVDKDKLYDFMDAVQASPEVEHFVRRQYDTTYYDLEIRAQDIDATIAKLEKYAPYGHGNPEPVFLITNYRLSGRMGAAYREVGEENDTIQLYGNKCVAVGFYKAREYHMLGNPQALQLVGTLSPKWKRPFVPNPLQATQPAQPYSTSTSARLKREPRPEEKEAQIEVLSMAKDEGYTKTLTSLGAKLMMGGLAGAQQTTP